MNALGNALRMGRARAQVLATSCVSVSAFSFQVRGAPRARLLQAKEDSDSVLPLFEALQDLARHLLPSLSLGAHHASIPPLPSDF